MKRLFVLGVLFLSLSGISYADFWNNPREIGLTDTGENVAEGSFYFTRLYLKYAGDALLSGKLFFVEKNGSIDTTNLWLINGMRNYLRNAREDAANSVNVFYEENNLLWKLNLDSNDNPKKVFGRVGHQAKKFVTLPFGILSNKLESLYNSASNNNKSFSKAYKQQGPLLFLPLLLWNHGFTLLWDLPWEATEAAWELTFRWGVRQPMKFVAALTKPVLPAAVSIFNWVVMQPLNLVAKAVPSQIASLTMGVAALIMVPFEGAKWLVWDWWQSPVEVAAETSVKVEEPILVAMPESPVKEEIIDILGSVVTYSELRVKISNLVFSSSNEDRWITLAYLSSTLDKVLIALKDAAAVEEVASVKHEMEVDIARLDILYRTYQPMLETELAAFKMTEENRI